MAAKEEEVLKKEKEQVVNTEKSQVTNTEQEQKEKTKGKKKKDQTKEVKEEKLPDYVDKILKVFNQYEKLFIDSNGGTFTSEVNTDLIGNAVLYDNPYYNK